MATYHVLRLSEVRTNKECSFHYAKGLRLPDQGTPKERVRYYVINGGWTASVFKDGRMLCNGLLLKGRPPVIVLAVKCVEFEPDYNEAIRKAFPRRR